jgi:hypothetical protein
MKANKPKNHSVAALSRSMCVCRKTIYRLAAKGVIPTKPDGSIDWLALDKQRVAATSPEQSTLTDAGSDHGHAMHVHGTGDGPHK